MHALDVRSWCAVTRVHVAATDPLRARRHPDLVTRAIVADHCAGGMRPVTVVIAGGRRIVPARITDAVMNRIVPVIIVIGVLAVPATVMRLKRVVTPANSSVRVGNNNLLPREPERPYLRRMRVIDARFDC